MRNIICFLVIVLELYALVDCSGVLKGKYEIGFFGYYTNLSNILVCIYFIGQVFQFPMPNQWDLIVMLTITVTFLIYHFILSPEQFNAHKEGRLSWNFFCPSNMLLHYILPVSTIFFWIFFAEKTDLRWFDGLFFLIIPLLYCIYIAIRKAFHIPISKNGNIYPYPFMDVDRFGMKVVARNILFLLVTFALLGTAVSWIASVI